MIKKIKDNKDVLIKVGLLYLYQCLIYFLSKFTPIHQHVIGNKIDDKIPFIAFFGLFYVLWYIAIIVIPLVLNKYKKSELKKYFWNMFIGITICGLFYIFYPTTMVREDVSIKGFFTLIVYLVYFFDRPVMNLFPSMHCLICFYFIYHMLFNKEIDKRWRIGTIVFSILVILSTVFIKQHVLIDIISAFIISVIVYGITSLIFRKGKNK